MPTFLGQKREIYWWFIQEYKRIKIGFLKNSLNKVQTLKWVQTFIIREKKNPQMSSNSGPELYSNPIVG